jgi:hypothetical protein
MPARAAAVCSIATDPSVERPSATIISTRTSTSWEAMSSTSDSTLSASFSIGTMTEMRWMGVSWGIPLSAARIDGAAG